MARRRIPRFFSVLVSLAATLIAAGTVGAQTEPPPVGGGTGTVILASSTTHGWHKVVLTDTGFPVTLQAQFVAGFDFLSIHACDNLDCTGSISFDNQVTIDPGTKPDMVLDSANLPVISFIKNGEVRVRKCSNTGCIGVGQVDSTAAPAIPARTPVSTELVLGPTGFPMIVTEYHGADGSKSLVLTRCNDISCTGNNEVQLVLFDAPAGTSAHPFTPSLALDAANFPTVAFANLSGTTPILSWIECGDRGCGSTQRFDSVLTGVDPRTPSVALDAAGLPVIAYHDAASSTLRTLRCIGDCSLNVWSRQTLPARGATPDVALGIDGRPVIASVGTGNVTQLIRCNDDRCADGNDTPMTLPSSTGSSDLEVSLALDANDDAVVTFTTPTRRLFRDEFCQGSAPTVKLALGQSPTAGDDVILGTPGNDTIDGLAGHDKICGAGGDDFIIGGLGNDQINGGPGSDWSAYTTNTGPVTTNLSSAFSSSGSDTLIEIENVWGTPFDDVINGNANANILVGDGGEDSISGGDGPDQLFGDQPVPTGPAAPNSLDGGPGDDYVQGGNAGDTIDGGPGNDQIYALGGNDTVEGDTGDDVLLGNDGDDNLAGDDGNDYLEPGPGTGAQIVTTTNGGAGNDWIQGGQSFTSILGGTGDDVILAGTEPLLADGGAGNDFFRGSDLGDTITTGPNFGAEADLDWVEANDGDDKITGSVGVDIVFAGRGADTVGALDGADYLNGGIGRDTLNGDEGDDYIEGGPDDDTINTGDGFGTAYGDSGDDTINGGPSVDFIDGGPNVDTIFGGAGDDFLLGGSADNDSVNGGPGDDTLFGGSGLGDTCTQLTVATPGFTAYDVSCEIQN